MSYELTIDKSPLKWWENILFFLGSPKRAYDGACCKCKVNGLLIDLGDGDRICRPCWDNYGDYILDKPNHKG